MTAHENLEATAQPSVRQGLKELCGQLATLTPRQRHELAMQGLPAAVAHRLLSSFKQVPRSALLGAIGVSPRVLARRLTLQQALDAPSTDRVLRLATCTALAIEALGSSLGAQQWLASPAIGLDRQRPIELLHTEGGAELVKVLLVRVEYGVYS